MSTTSVNIRPRSLGFTSLILGFLGLVLWWWVPLGMVLALAGLVLGFIGATLHPNRRLIIGLVVAGILLCLVAVALDVDVAIRGLETINLTSMR